METKENIVDEYLHRLQNGDISALDGLYECTYRQLFALCYSYFHNSFDCEDTIHDTYLTIVRNINKYNGSRGFNWIFTLTKNICLNKIKRKKRMVATDFSMNNAYTLDNASYESYIHDESGIFSAAESVLNENEFRIVILHAISGMYFREIAQGLGKIEATVRWQYNNAKKKLNKYMKGRMGYEK